MRAAISHTTFIGGCNSDCSASPSSSSSSSSSCSSASSISNLPDSRTPDIAFHYSTTSPTRYGATSMFEVSLDKLCSDSHVEGNCLVEPLNHLFSTHSSFQHTFFEDNQGLVLTCEQTMVFIKTCSIYSFFFSKGRRHRRNGRRRFQARLASLPKGLNKNGDFLSIIGSTNLPMARSGRLQGAGGVFMALVVALITLLAAAKQGLSMGSNQHQEMSCSMCNGLRFHLCSLCKGRGIVEWEGKLRHIDPCPRCFGSCRMKCSSCGM